MTESWEYHDAEKPSCDCTNCMNRHHSEPKPHWSIGLQWPTDRWDPLNTAPTKGYPVLHVRGRRADGSVIDQMHYAYGGGDEQPPFRGWFAPYGGGGDGFYQASPVEWQPLEVIR